MIGKSVPRLDAKDKVLGLAKYTEDLLPRKYLVAKILHSTIANGLVKNIDIEKAAALSGIIKIITCFDVPKIPFATAGRPESSDPLKRDVEDRLLLSARVRFYGDDIAAVVAVDDITAEKALGLIGVEYEQYTPLLTVAAAASPEASQIHEGVESNRLAHTEFAVGDIPEISEENTVYSGVYHTQMVQHCHLENAVCYAYMEGQRIVVVSATQIPHTVRRITAQALGISVGRVRVIKPMLGGGFGNNRDVLYEPLCAYLTTQVDGKAVRILTSREETFVNTRVRHPITFELKSILSDNGKFLLRNIHAISNQGAYASRGHEIAENATVSLRHLYSAEGAVRAQADTYYTNLPTGGAMRGCGVPQAIFAMESHIDDIAFDKGMDPMVLRIMNCIRAGYEDPITGISVRSYGLDRCIIKGREMIDWDNKRREYQNQTGNLRHGIGMAIFSHKTGLYPTSIETAAARIILDQDGSVMVSMGAVEVGQGADTVSAQMVADTLSIPIDMVHIVSTQDTDVTPFDTTAYAGRQSYVSGWALKKAAIELRSKILKYAAKHKEIDETALTIENGFIVEKETMNIICELPQLAKETYCSPTDSVQLTAEVTHQCFDNTLSFGACFAEITVDIQMCKITVDKLINVHDSGVILNPQLAEGQVHGGMSMGLGYALGEQMLFNPETGALYNGNLLDYKMGTAMDTPELVVEFVETDEENGPYGNKALGELPVIPVAPAIRNALLHATGIKFNTLPITPEVMFEEFKGLGLI